MHNGMLVSALGCGDSASLPTVSPHESPHDSNDSIMGSIPYAVPTSSFSLIIDPTCWLHGVPPHACPFRVRIPVWLNPSIVQRGCPCLFSCKAPGEYKPLMFADCSFQALQWVLCAIWAASRGHFAEAQAHGLRSHSLQAHESRQTQALWPRVPNPRGFVSPHSWWPWMSFSFK